VATGTLAGVRAPWAGYVRVSHVGGRGGEAFRSPDEQEHAIRSWAGARGEPVVVLDHELDESGGREDRPVLEQAVAGIEAGEYRGLVVAYLSRASRSVRHLLTLWDRVEAAGGQVVAVAENVDTSTPAGRLTRTMLAAIAEHELDLHRERFEALRESATRAGIWQHRQTPVGYQRGENRRLEPDARAPAVREAFARRAAGASISDVARLLDLTNSGARQALRNRVYLGELRVGKHVNQAAHEPLVDEDTWLAAQPNGARPPRRRGEIALLAGIARCAGCGMVMSRARTPSGDGYVCHRGGGRAAACDAPATILGERLEQHVVRIALGELARIEARAVNPGERVDQARIEQAAAERELHAYLAAVSAADVGEAAFRAGARERGGRVERAAGEVQRLLAHRGTLPLVNAAEVWPDLTVTQRNRVLRGLIEAVLVRRSGGRTVPPGERVRVVAAGAGLITPYQGGGTRMPRGAVWVDADDPRVLR
jgi:site-specific DNA recombinase